MHKYCTVILSQHIRKYFLLFICLPLLNSVCGQTTFDTDSAFQAARTLAFSGNRNDSRIILRKILEVKPSYTEVQTLLGRTYAWDGKYDSARAEIKQALSFDNKNEDATNALIDVELWSDNYRAALDESNKALKEINPRSEDFLLKKARAQTNLKNYKEANVTIQELLKINSRNEKAISLDKSVKKEIRINSVGAAYYYDQFSTTFTPWNQASVFYSRKTKLLGSVTGRINYAHRFDTSGTQYEIDMYPKLTKKIYSYFNFGYSHAGIFPKYRFGFSLYSSLPNSFEGEIGFRYLKFNDATLIYTASLGKYISNWWFNIRGNYIPGNIGPSWSLALISRLYLSDADNYLSLTLGTGFAPDEFASNINIFSPVNVSSQRARLGFQHRLWNNYLFTTSAGYGRDEYRKGFIRNNYNFSTGLEMFF